MIKNKITKKTIAIFLTLNFLSSLAPFNGLYANNNGPNAPEASNFEPVSATDMVNLSSGDLAYVLPLLEVDGFPVTLSYHAGIPMDMEASWVGLGWNINTGAIARGVVSTPDDWNSGESMKFTYYTYESETYSVNVGVGFSKAAEVGVGLSWGSNKSLSGSVSASIGPVSASIDTDGNYGVGINSSVITQGMGFDGVFDKVGSEGGGKKTPFGGSLSLSGNTSGGGVSVGANGGYSKNGLQAGLGVSVSGNGIGGGYSIGGGSGEGYNKRSSGSGGSIGSFSTSDMNINSSGFFVPISIGIFSFGFGYQKQTIKYSKGLNRYGFGSLYQWNANSSNDLYNRTHGEKSGFPGNLFNDIQRRNYYGDIYDQEIPQTEKEFVSDYNKLIEKVNFTFSGYDSYNVNASGINGNLSPFLGENSVLIGEGYEGNDSDIQGKKMKVFYHNSQNTNSSTPLLSPTKKLQSKNLYFTFDGQVTNNIQIGGGFKSDVTQVSNLNINSFIDRGSSYLNRPTTGSFVEVYTNAQLDGIDKNSVLFPSSIYKENQSNLRRVEDLGYMPEGIGGYKITTPDGKVYHFAQPVYQYEKIEHNYVEIDQMGTSPYNSSSKRTGTPYATHWLLTAITGPDFIDKNGNNFPDEEDYGYWLRLDHGRWSNAYSWRTPYAATIMADVTTDNSITINGNGSSSKNYRRYSTFNEDNVNKSDAGHFLQGRKDLYYLDKIVSKNQIAYFVKDIRKDGLGTDLNYYFNSGSGNSTLNGEVIKFKENAKYELEYLLKLDKIIITKNEGRQNYINTSSGNGLGSLSEDSKTGRYWSGQLFNSNLPLASQTHHLHQSDEIIDVNDLINYDYNKALKTIEFNYDYELATNSPNSIASSVAGLHGAKGRLSLQEVKFYGRNMWDYMPPYQFNYKRPEQQFNRNDIPSSKGDEKDMSKKDSWGFIEGNENGLTDNSINRKTLADSWSLNQIKTPQGSTIDVEYEEDDFYVEAFSRRFWNNNLKFKIKKLSNQSLELEVYNDNDNEQLNFNDYFEPNDSIYFDLWLALKDRLWYDWGGWLKSNSHLNIPVDKFPITYLSASSMKINIPLSKYEYIVGGRSNRNLLTGNCFWKKNLSNCYSNYNYVDVPRGEYPTVGNNDRRYTMSYKFLASKSPMGKSGGGLKVSKVIVNGDLGEKYETEYSYNVPGTTRSSGITSFYPVYGTKYVPYQSELPGPGVMYEWVTMKAKGYTASGAEIPSEETVYHYHTLQPNFEIFDPNFTMKDRDGEVLFRATVTDKEFNTANIVGKKIKLEKNLAKVGQLISTEQYNSRGHLMNKTINHYISKNARHQETFTSLKSVYRYDDNDGNLSNRVLKNRLLSLSTKIEQGKVLDRVTTYTPKGVSSIQYSNPDPYLGTFRTSERTKSDGTKIKETKYPAYEMYYQMGSKINNPDNKNMLTQESMNVTSINGKAINASVTTWNTTWRYRDQEGNESNDSDVWRKHKTFVWKGDLDSQGTYGRSISPSDFNWGVNAVQNNEEWEKVSEITRYTHYSSPIETKDINGNFASSKMADNWSKVVAGGNARFTEMYFSGAEHVLENGKLEGEIEGVIERSTQFAHTGKYSLRVTDPNSQYFKVNIQSGANHLDSTKNFRPGKYKVSVWAHAKSDQSTVLKYNNQTIPVESSVLASGNSGYWTQLNYIIDVQPNSNSLLYFTGSNGSGSHFDDFRLYPISSTMNSYVYDNETDELIYILDSNNMATKFEYDNAGRLLRVYKEVERGYYDSPNNGGFKLVKEYNYNYKNQ